LPPYWDFFEMSKLVSVGLDAPSDFPAAHYNECQRIAEERCALRSEMDEFRGAWNAVAYRFQAMTEAGDSFAAALEKHGTHPPPKERYQQESDLSTFFSSGFATFEAAFYGLYALGAMVNGSPLSLATAKDKQSVSPSRVHVAFSKAFAGDSSLAAIGAVLNDIEFKTFRETRNILTHRTAPGRTIYVGIGGDQELPTEWKLNNTPLDKTVATRGRSHVARLLTAIVRTSEDFGNRML
jgi:hypothetical protein